MHCHALIVTLSLHLSRKQFVYDGHYYLQLNNCRLNREITRGRCFTLLFSCYAIEQFLIVKVAISGSIYYKIRSILLQCVALLPRSVAVVAPRSDEMHLPKTLITGGSGMMTEAGASLRLFNEAVS